MYDIACIHAPNAKELGFQKIYDVSKLSSKFLESAFAESLRQRARKCGLIFFRTYEPELSLIRAVGTHRKSALVISLRELLAAKGPSFSTLLARIRLFLLLCRKYKAPYVLCTLAKSVPRGNA